MYALTCLGGQEFDQKPRRIGMGRVLENSNRIERDRHRFQDEPIGRRATLRTDHRVMAEHHESAASGDFGVPLFRTQTSKTRPLND